MEERDNEKKQEKEEKIKMNYRIIGETSAKVNKIVKECREEER